jgi:ADP-heptose:LPS heptosyltransferase
MIAGPADDVPAAKLAAAGYPVARPPDLLALAALLARVDVYLGNDSGVSHLAAALGVPTVAIFGPTDPRIWAPRGPRVTVLWGGPGALQLDPAAALALVTEDAAAGAVEAQLASAPGARGERAGADDS